MRRLPWLFLMIGTMVIVIVALLISVLRLVLPELNYYRPQLLTMVTTLSGVPMQIDFMQGSWHACGPSLEMRNINAILRKGNLHIKHLTLTLDIWQSLLHWQWKFRDLTFQKFQLNLDNYQSNSMNLKEVNNLIFHQFNHLDLYDSHISFVTSTGVRAALDISKLTLLNRYNNHCAEGQISLSALNGRHGVVYLRADLIDKQGLLKTGSIYLQAGNINLKPWSSYWLNANTELENANLSLKAWLQIQNGEIASSNLLLKKGTAKWGKGAKQHQLDLNHVVLSIHRQGTGWKIDAPQWHVSTDGKTWPKGMLHALWLPESIKERSQEEFRLRMTNIQLERLTALLPTFSFLSPSLLKYWHDLQPQGKLKMLALDIPLKHIEETRFQALWASVSWQNWKLLPGVNHLAGILSGRVAEGRIILNLNSSTLPYKNMFRTPLEISNANCALTWRYRDQNWELASEGLEVKAKSLWLNGDFRYQHPAKGPPWLSILAGIRLYNCKDAWRYFPEPIMGKPLVDYLSKGIQDGQVENATLIYEGDPQHFPYHKNEGLFEMLIPLRHSTFQFQPGWPALTDLAIDLDFINDGLKMQTAHVNLNKVEGKNISAVIQNYFKKRLLIDAELMGSGTDLYDYFKKTPLSHSLGAVLDKWQLDGNINGRLHLDIPLDSKQVKAAGEVTLHNNSLRAKLLGSELHQISGKFRFENNKLQSDTLSAQWFGQPISLNLNAQQGTFDYKVYINLKADWEPAKFLNFPVDLTSKCFGSIYWQSRIAITLPHEGRVNYNIGIAADLTKISSHLPAPLNKPAGRTLPLRIKISGGLNNFTLTAGTSRRSYFNSKWFLTKKYVRLMHAIWKETSTITPPLPTKNSLIFNIPALDGDQWLALLTSALKGPGGWNSFIFPDTMILKTPQLILFGQVWNNLTLSVKQKIDRMQINAKGDEINGNLQLANRGPWRANITYLSYNPKFLNGKSAPAAVNQKVERISLPNYLTLILRCKSCWLLGQDYGAVKANLTQYGDRLILDCGLIDTSKARVSASGEWKRGIQGVRSSLKGKLLGSEFNALASFLGITMPLKGGPYNVDFDLYWQGQPWKPKVDTLRGVLQVKIGKGKIDSIGGSRARQLLRLVSFDAFLRKLQFDFSDTFGQGFYFDSIQSTASLKDGIIHTDNLFIDGLSADISINGQIDLLRHWIDMKAVVAPAISATIGVATAFAINPVVGAAIFAASQVLGPLWSKISLIRYQIVGDLEQPKIHEVLRTPKKNKTP